MERHGENIYFDEKEQERFNVPVRLGSGAARCESIARMRDAEDRSAAALVIRLVSSNRDWMSQAVGARRQMAAELDLEFANNLYAACPSYTTEDL